MSIKQDTSTLQSYLFFNGRCEEAIEFYRQAIGAEVEMILRHKDSPEKGDGCAPAGFENKIMHCSLRIGKMQLLMSDGCSTEKIVFDGFSLALSVATEAEADSAFNALAAGGQVRMPLEKTFWSPRFGMLQDRFGLGWMVMVPGNHNQS